MACTADYFIIDDKTLPSEDFDISRLEVGFSVYEVVKIIDGIPLFLEEHIKRLHISCKLKNRSVWIEDQYIENKISELIQINNIKSGRLKFALRFHESENNFICFFLEKIEPKAEVYKKGVKIISKIHERNNPNAKVINYDLRKAVRKLIKKENVFETLLINKQEKISECSKSNIFFIKGDSVYTSKSSDVLIGITRNRIFEICKNEDITIFETDIYYKQLSEFDSAFISGTSIGILGIKKIDKIKFKLSNKILFNLSNVYNLITKDYIESYKSDKKSNPSIQ